MKLSICMIARDEERDLPRLLASITGLADELILVDTGSTDRTRELATAAGAIVHEIVWPNDFAAARNASLEHATGDWILVLDADEEVVEVATLRAELEEANKLGLGGLSLVMRNLSPPGEATTYQDLPIVRAFRRGIARYEGRIHEQISPAIQRVGGVLGASDLHLLHHGYTRKEAQGVDRARRNLALLEAAVAAEPDDMYLRYQLGVTMKAVGDPKAEDVLRSSLRARGALSPAAAADVQMRLAQLALLRGDNAAAFNEAHACLKADAANVIALQITIVAGVALNRGPDVKRACTALLGQPNVAAQVRADAEALLKLL
ncbi:MAG: glycosyltransferase family 2 protein [Kofleriaceae bacterium]